MNISIKPIKAFIQENFLYDNDPAKKKLVEAEIIAVSSYVGSPITFHAIIENSYLYSDLPITAFYHLSITHEYSLQSLAAVKCPAHELENFTFNKYVDKEIACFLNHGKTWANGTYITSFDFYTDNEMVHLVKLHGGRFALVPNHKINWNNKRELSDYKKNHQIYNW